MIWITLTNGLIRAINGWCCVVRVWRRITFNLELVVLGDKCGASIKLSGTNLKLKIMIDNPMEVYCFLMGAVSQRDVQRLCINPNWQLGCAPSFIMDMHQTMN